MRGLAHGLKFECSYYSSARITYVPVRLHAAGALLLSSLEAPIQSAAEAEAFVRDTCAELLKRGKRFCNKELEITHKQLIREQRQFGGKKFAPLVVDAIAEDKARAVAILQERRLKREEREREMRVLYESSTMV